MTLEPLERRAREVRSRALVRAWEFRQRHRAKGVWFRLRQALAHAAEAWVLPDGETRALLEEGYRPLGVGHELEPPIEVFVLPSSRLESISGKVRIRVGLTAQLLSASALALVAFHGTDDHHQD